MSDERILSHTVWDSKYHLVRIPKYRKNHIFGLLRKHLGPSFRDLALQEESRVKEGHVMSDHLHMFVPIPSEYSVARVLRFIKGKSAI